MNLSRLLFSITVLLTYPIECFVCREVLVNVFWPEITTSEEERNENPWWRHAGLTILLVALAYACSLITDCLAFILEMNGILAAIPMAFIFPALCYIKLEEGPLLSKAKGPAWLLALFAMIVTGLGVISLISNGIPDCHEVAASYCKSIQEKEVQ